MKKIRYIGCFFDLDTILQKAEEQQPQRLFKSIVHPHVTFAYLPDTVPCDLFGRIVTVKVTGYGRDDENEAFAVEFLSLDEELEKRSLQIRVPHITISVSKNGEAVNSGNLSFAPITPFCLEGVFGGMGADGKVYTRP